MKKHAIIISAIAAGFVIGASAISVFADNNWQGPCDTPPKCNVAAPLNVGSGTALLGIPGIQEKTDSLIIDGGLNVRGNLVIATGTPGFGKVLTAVDTSGTATWQTPAAAAAGFLPAPAYDSGWITVDGSSGKYPYTPGGWGMYYKGLQHNLGTTNTLVYLEWKDVSGAIGTTGLFSSGEEFSGGSDRGFSWINKTANGIVVVRSKDQDASDQVRILMWKIGS